jgi:hypothetical protein
VAVKIPFLKGEIRRRKKCSEHLKELDRNVGETEVDQTDPNPGTDYKDIPFKNGFIRLEADAFKFLRNLLFMTSI